MRGDAQIHETNGVSPDLPDELGEPMEQHYESGDDLIIDEEDGETMEGVYDEDPETELTRSEGTPTPAAKWKSIITKCATAEELREKLSKVKPFARDPTNNRIVATASLKNLTQGFCDFLDGPQIKIKTMRMYTEVFGCCDLLFYIVRELPDKMKNISEENGGFWRNVFNFMKVVPNPRETVSPMFFRVRMHPIKQESKKVFINAYEKVWLAFLACPIPSKLLLAFIPHFTEHVLDHLTDPFLTVDFFFRCFKKGDIYAILSLGAIFKLIVSHNFEYKDFYDEVYALTKPSLLYLDQKEKFFTLLDTFLSSSHIPVYIVAGFIKRLSRMLLLAPLDAQEPLLGLIRNLITRHPTLFTLVHRELPSTMDCDPYNVDEPLLSKCGAMESSLWELKAIQKHWHSSVAKRANFVDKPPQKLESFVRFRCQDEYFSNMMGKKFGSEANSEDAKYSRMQDGSDEDEDQPPTKRAKKAKGSSGKFDKKHQEARANSIPTNFVPPVTNGTWFPQNSFSMDFSNFWKV